MPRTGRPTIFTPKDGATNIQALKLTGKGQRAFERIRGVLKKWARWPKPPSDADTIDLLVRGFDEDKARAAYEKERP